MAQQTRVQLRWVLGIIGGLAIACGGSDAMDSPDGDVQAPGADASGGGGGGDEADAGSGGGGGGGGSGAGLDVSGFPDEEEAAIVACATDLPASVGDGDLTIVRDDVDQSGCLDPVGLTSADLDAECGFAEFEMASGQSTLKLRDALMIDHPDFLCYVVAGALSDLWIRDNAVTALVGYQDAFGISQGQRCYACPSDSEAGCEARDVVSPGATRDSHLRARIDMREAMVATFDGSWPYDSVRWVDDGDSSCSGAARQTWIDSMVVSEDAMPYTVVDLDVQAECGQAGKTVRIRFTPDSGGGALSVNSVALMDPRDAVQFYEPSGPAGAGETWGRTHGAAGSDWITRAIYWASGPFTATVSDCNY